MLIFQHDDIMVNLTTVRRFISSDNSTFFAGMPSTEGWRMEEKDFETWLTGDKWVPDTGDMWHEGVVPIYRRLLERDNGAFFRREGSECHEV